MITNIEAPKSVNDKVFIGIREKMDKLDTFFDRVENATVFLKREKKDPIKGKMAEIKLAVPGPDLFTSASADTYEKAFALAFNKMKKLLVKAKKERFNPNYKSVKEI